MHNKRFTILIVDDNAANIFALRTLLSRVDDCEVIETSSGEEALVSTLEHDIHLVLLDVQMPVMDGFETARHLKMTRRTKHIPIIFITAVFKAEEFRKKGYAVGAVDYITKPIDDNQLLNRIHLYRQIFEREQRLHLSMNRLQASETRLQMALEAGQEGMWDWNLQTGSLYLSPHWEEMLGYPTGTIKHLYRSYEERIHPEDLSAFHNVLEQLDAGAIEQFEIEQRLQCADGEYLWSLAHGKVADKRDSDGLPVRVIGTHINITARKEAERQLLLAGQVIETMPEGVLLIDAEEKIIAVNPAFIASSGYSENESVGAKASLLKSGRHDELFFQEMRAILDSSGQWQGEIWNRRKNGEIYPEWLNATVIVDRDDQVSYYVCIYSDLSSQEHIRKRLHHLAYYDVLTELPNRELFQDRLINAITIARREQKKAALIFIDLDRFKIINDTLGHSIGDALLQNVAKRLKSCLRESDTVARIGGDEFTVIVYPFDHEDDAAATVAKKIVEAMRYPMEIEGNTLHVTTSVGIGIYPSDGEDSETLLRNADAAMYHAKERGRNNFQFYSKEMTALVMENFCLEKDLRNAVGSDQFRLYFQPLVDLASEQIVGAEALIRWEHPDKGLIPPDKFIPVAENIGLIATIDEWVINDACRHFAAWHKADYALDRISVNISGFEIEHVDLVELTRAALECSGIDPHQLELEVSERFIPRKGGKGIETLESLRELGVGLAIDDFGMGYSSLTYLKRLPINRLKIDRSFVKNIPEDTDDVAIARAVIALAKSLSLSVIAEGVENEEQRQILVAEGCNEGQGYMFGRAMPLEAFELLLKRLQSQEREKSTGVN